MNKKKEQQLNDLLSKIVRENLDTVVVTDSAGTQNMLFSKERFLMLETDLSLYKEEFFTQCMI